MKHLRHTVILALLLASAPATFSQSTSPQSVFDGMPPVQAAPAMPGLVPAPMPQMRLPVSGPDFARLLNAINSQTFASNQLPMVQAAGLCGWFTCEQCAALMNIFDFDDNKLKVVAYLAPHLVDPIRSQPIMESLSFVSNQQKAWQIISAAQP